MNRADDRVAERAAQTEEPVAFALPRPSRTLTALASSALALPGIASSAKADAPIERATASSAFSYYLEDNLAPSKFFDDDPGPGEGSGSRERYEVYTKQLRFDFPVSERFDLGVDFLYEEMSGASPWFVNVQPGDPKLLQVMSGATIEDERIDGTIDLDYFMDNGKDTFSGGFSRERDYVSMHLGLGAERNFNDKNTVLNASGAFSYDWVNPTDSENSFRPGSDQRWGIDLFAAMSQIVSRAATVQATVNYKHSQGFLNDPYKAVTFLDGRALITDERPDTKDQVSLMLRYRHHFEALGGSAHGDYRFYADDWGVLSHTVEVAWYQTFLDYFTFAPTVRWYTQSKADFYEAILPAAAAPSERTSDFRLSPYGAISIKGKLEVELKDLFDYRPPRWLEQIGISEGLDVIAALSYERYVSDGAFSITSVSESDEAPGLVSFQVVAITLSGRF